MKIKNVIVVMMMIVMIVMCVGISVSEAKEKAQEKKEFHLEMKSESKSTKLKGVEQLLSCVGSSHGAMTLRSDWREQLKQTQRDIGFRSIRFHGILDDDMSTFLNGKVNLFNVFSTLDFLITLDIAP